LLPGTATIHGGGDPRFGGLNPEPLPSNLSGLRRRVLASPRPAIGLATDGDGDRLAAVAEDGRVVDAHHLLALIYMHLLELRLLRGGAVRTVTTSGLVDRVAAAHGLTVDVTPVGFRHVAGRLEPAAEPGALIGGEESGGLGLALHIPERDAVFASLVLLEHLAMSGRSLGEAVDRLEERFGRVVLGRLDLHCRTGLAERLERACPVPSSLAGVAVSGAERLDGLTIRLADGGRLHVRASHTEPVLRLYAEARAPEGMRALLEAGRALVRAGGRGPRGGCAP
jgi:phosphomannomutase